VSAALAALLQGGPLPHRLRAVSLESVGSEVRVEVDPGEGSGPDLRAELLESGEPRSAYRVEARGPFWTQWAGEARERLSAAIGGPLRDLVGDVESRTLAELARAQSFCCFLRARG